MTVLSQARPTTWSVRQGGGLQARCPADARCRRTAWSALARGLAWTLVLVCGVLPVARAQAIEAAQLAVVVNDADPASVATARYYQHQRGLPAANLIHVHLPAGTVSELEPARFAEVRASILAATPPGVQAYAIAWTTPYRVGCMSITSALTFGYDPGWCSQDGGCHMTRDNPLFDYRTSAPFDDLGVRPSMLLAGSSESEVRALIDRGRRSDHSHPRGGAYLVVTDDRARSTRTAAFLRAARLHVPGLAIHLVHANALPPRDKVLFYFTGAAQVPGLRQQGFLPGAVGDHLTSFGGDLEGEGQMSALRWLEAGATGSYGTVHEPCNYAQKFPDPAVLLRWYSHGDTLIEAYWKSVSAPGEGLFIGEPLARPWR